MAGLSLTVYPVNLGIRCQLARGQNRAAPHSKWRSWQFPEQCPCLGINRAAQNGSRTALKMLTLLRCVARLPVGYAVGFPLSVCICEPMAKSDQPTTIKKYANRRLYNTGTSTYVTLQDLAAMVKDGEAFLVYDGKT